MSIHFTCPHCGKATEVAEQYAGQSGPCAACGRTITVPNLAPGPGFAPPVQGGGFPMWAILLILGAVTLPVLIIAILIALLVPAVSATRQSARRVACVNNLKQIGLALYAYENMHGRFPPAYIADKDGRPMHSWRVLILPYMEEQALYDRYDFKEPWDGPHNRLLADEMPRIYCCPDVLGAGGPGKCQTSYMMVTGPGMVSSGADAKTRNDASRIMGNSRLILVAEVGKSGVNWMEPVDCKAADLLHKAKNHSTTRNVVFADGHAESLSDEELKKLLDEAAVVPPFEVK